MGKQQEAEKGKKGPSGPVGEGLIRIVSQGTWRRHPPLTLLAAPWQTIGGRRVNSGPRLQGPMLLTPEEPGDRAGPTRDTTPSPTTASPRRPLGLEFVHLGKPWVTPLTTASRSSSISPGSCPPLPPPATPQASHSKGQRSVRHRLPAHAAWGHPRITGPGQAAARAPCQGHKAPSHFSLAGCLVTPKNSRERALPLQRPRADRALRTAWSPSREHGSAGFARRPPASNSAQPAPPTPPARPPAPRPQPVAPPVPPGAPGATGAGAEWGLGLLSRG